MAHFAQLDENSIVQQVLVVDNTQITDENGVEQELLGIAFLQSLFGSHTVWKQTSYNGNIRKNYASIGFAYDASCDAFIPPKPFASWKLNEATCQWEPPVAMPNDGPAYAWDEANQNWKRV